MNTRVIWLCFVGLSIAASVILLYPHFYTPPQKVLRADKLRISEKKQQQQNSLTAMAEQPNGAGAYYAAKRLPKGMSAPVANYTQAIVAKRNFLASQTAFTAEPWQNLGPENVGGRTRSLIFHPQNPDIMYAGGVSGGVWKSTNAGASWIPIADDLENMAVVTLAIIPGTPSTIIAGTGEGVYVGRPVVRSRGVEGNGIYRSQNGGETWQALDFTLDNPDFRFVNKIRVGDDNTLFAATESGIWRSTNIGDSWELVLDQSSVVGGCHEVEIEPGSSPNRLLVSCGSFETATVNRSSDNGASWQVVLEEPFQGRTTIAYAASNPNRVYALSAQNQFGPYPYGLNVLYRSDDAGLNWSLVASTDSQDPNSRAILSTTNYVFDCGVTGQFQPGRFAGASWYYNLITVDPTNADRIWVGSLDLWRSEDGGSNFELGSFWWASDDQPSHIHGDHHLLVYHPNYDGVVENRLYGANDGGLWLSQNSGADAASDNCDPSTSQVEWNAINTDYAVTQFYHGSVASDGKTLIGGSQDNGTQWRDENGQWQEILGGDGSYSAIDPVDPSLVYVSSQYANLVRTQLSDSGNQQTGIGSEFDAPGLFITPFILDPNDNNRLWLAGLALWRSDDRGDNWVKASRDEYTMNYIDGLSALAAQPGNSNLLLLGGSDGHIYRHTSALSGDQAFIMEKIKIADGYVSSINFDPNNSNKVVATVSTFGQLHAWKSVDAGMSWQAIDQPGVAGLPDLPAHDILIAPHDTDTLYIATDIGVYVSKNDGVSWQPLTTGLPNVPVEKIVYNQYQSQTNLFAFTYGRGVFKSELTSIFNSPPQVSQPTLTFSVVENSAIVLDVREYFSDADGDSLSYSASGLPVGVVISTDGVLSGNSNVIGSHVVSIIASDGEAEATLVLMLTITEAPESSSGGGSISYWWLVLIMLIGVTGNGTLCIRANQ